jgi:hypothetical protein
MPSGSLRKARKRREADPLLTHFCKNTGDNQQCGEFGDARKRTASSVSTAPLLVTRCLYLPSVPLSSLLPMESL